MNHRRTESPPFIAKKKITQNIQGYDVLAPARANQYILLNFRLSQPTMTTPTLVLIPAAGLDPSVAHVRSITNASYCARCVYLSIDAVRRTLLPFVVLFTFLGNRFLFINYGTNNDAVVQTAPIADRPNNGESVDRFLVDYLIWLQVHKYTSTYDHFVWRPLSGGRIYYQSKLFQIQYGHRDNNNNNLVV